MYLLQCLLKEHTRTLRFVCIYTGMFLFVIGEKKSKLLRTYSINSFVMCGYIYKLLTEEEDNVSEICI